MSKYDALWKYISSSGKDELRLTFEQIENINELPIDHSFLNCKKELNDFGYCVKKISLKERTVLFEKII